MYRCIADACGKPFPRQVNFCPYCGTRQAAAPAHGQAHEPAGGRWSDTGNRDTGGAAHGHAAGRRADADSAGASGASGGSGASGAQAGRAAGFHEVGGTGADRTGADSAGAAAGNGPGARGVADEAGRQAAGSLSANDWGRRQGQPASGTAPDAAATAGAAEAAAQAQADAAARAAALAQARAAGNTADGAAGQAAGNGAAARAGLSDAQQSTLDRLNKLRGAGTQAGAGAQGGNPSRPQAPRDAAPSRPPLRKPIGKGVWAAVVLLLGAIWFLARPSDPAAKLEARTASAVELAQACDVDQARSELAQLKSDKAGAQQLKRVQDAINAHAKKCDTRRRRTAAWSELLPQLDKALESGQLERANSRLAAFTKQWGADDETREWDARIDTRIGERLLDEADECLKKADRACVEAKLQSAQKLQRNELKPRIELLREGLSRLLETTVLEQREPAAARAPQAGQPAPAAPAAVRVPQTSQAPAPAAQPPRPAAPVQVAPPGAQQAQQVQQAQQARKLLAEAERELQQGNYKAAMDKANICATMIDAGNRECTALKHRAERLNRDLLNCVAGGREWIDDRCQ